MQTINGANRKCRFGVFQTNKYIQKMLQIVVQGSDTTSVIAVLTMKHTVRDNESFVESPLTATGLD